MSKVISFFKTKSPFLLLLIAIVIELLSKLIEKKLEGFALGLQSISFIIIVYSLIRLFNRK